MPPTTVSVELAIGTPITGGWCSTCLLSSLVRIPLWQVTQRGMTLLSVAEVCNREGKLRWLRGGPELLEFPE
jgi:hypothetical protein